MAAGDWILGSHIELASGTTFQFTENAVSVAAYWNVIQPSGRIVFTPGGPPFAFTANLSAPLGTSLQSLAQALADQEFLPVHVTQLGVVIYPDGWDATAGLQADSVSSSTVTGNLFGLAAGSTSTTDAEAASALTISVPLAAGSSSSSGDAAVLSS